VNLIYLIILTCGKFTNNLTKQNNNYRRNLFLWWSPLCLLELSHTVRFKVFAYAKDVLCGQDICVSAQLERDARMFNMWSTRPHSKQSSDFRVAAGGRWLAGCKKSHIFVTNRQLGMPVGADEWVPALDRWCGPTAKINAKKKLKRKENGIQWRSHSASRSRKIEDIQVNPTACEPCNKCNKFKASTKKCDTN